MHTWPSEISKSPIQRPDDTGHHYRDRTRFGQGLEEGWEFYAWLQRSLPPEARLLTPYPNVSASAAGIKSPKSGRDRQLFSDSATTPAYEEGLRFLNCDDLAEMGITHSARDRGGGRRAHPCRQALARQPGPLRVVGRLA